MITNNSAFAKDPVEKNDLPAIVAEKIIKRMKDGSLAAGDKLPTVAGLAKTLNVGQSSVREGLKQLQTLGLLEIKHGKGVYIKDNDIGTILKDIGHLLILKKADIQYLIEARRIIECGIVKLAVEKASAEEIEELHSLLNVMKSSVDSPEDFVDADLGFHLELGAASKNPLLSQFLNSIYGLFHHGQEVVMSMPGAAKNAIKRHREIYLAIKNRDQEKALRAMEKHLTYAEATISAYYT